MTNTNASGNSNQSNYPDFPGSPNYSNYIDQNTLDDIRARADIVTVIERYLPLERKGKEYLAVCPFHEDHSPSLHISPDKQIYKCFVCQSGGNVFSFVQHYEKISFAEAVAKVAQICGIDYKPAKIQQPARPANPLQPLYETMQTFIDYTYYNLSTAAGAGASAYLKKRKFTPELIEKFQIGYAPDASSQQKYFSARKADSAKLLDTGLYRKYEDQNIRPFFTNRITIPIHDEFGHPVGITARLLPGAQGPKYINTTTTRLYEKGRIIFNYHRAAPQARKSGRLILVEGAMDVLGLEKAGIGEGIAMLGTAITSWQLNQIRRLGVPVRVFYDNDQAGKQAVWKFGQAAMKAGIPFAVVDNAMEKDPDEIVISHGPEALLKIVDRTVSFAQFSFDFLQSQYNLENYEDRKTYARILNDIIRQTADIHEQPALYAKLRDLTGMEYGQSRPSVQTVMYPDSWTDYPAQPVYDDFVPADQPADGYGYDYDYEPVPGPAKNHAVQAYPEPGLPNSPKKYKNVYMQPPPMEQGRLQAEKIVLASMLVDKKYADIYKEKLGFFKDPQCHQLSLYIYEAYRQNPNLDGPGLMKQIREENVSGLLDELLKTEAHLINDQCFEDSMTKIQEASLAEQIELCSQKIKTARDTAERVRLMKEKTKLVRQQKQLRQRKDRNR